MRQELVAATAPEKLRDASEKRGKSSAATRGRHGAGKQRCPPQPRVARRDVRGEKTAGRRAVLTASGGAGLHPDSRSRRPAPGSGHAESPRLTRPRSKGGRHRSHRAEAGRGRAEGSLRSVRRHLPVGAAGSIPVLGAAGGRSRSRQGPG